jgi:hypothetical protein
MEKMPGEDGGDFAIVGPGIKAKYSGISAGMRVPSDNLAGALLAKRGALRPTGSGFRAIES